MVTCHCSGCALSEPRRRRHLEHARRQHLEEAVVQAADCVKRSAARGCAPLEPPQRHCLNPRAFSSASSSNRARTSELLSLLRTYSSCSWLAAEAGRGRRAGLAVLQPQLELVEIAQLLIEQLRSHLGHERASLRVFDLGSQQLHSLLVAGIATPVEHRQPQPPMSWRPPWGSKPRDLGLHFCLDSGATSEPRPEPGTTGPPSESPPATAPTSSNQLLVVHLLSLAALPLRRQRHLWPPADCVYRRPFSSQEGGGTTGMARCRSCARFTAQGRFTTPLRAPDTGRGPDRWPQALPPTPGRNAGGSAVCQLSAPDRQELSTVW